MCQVFVLHVHPAGHCLASPYVKLTAFSPLLRTRFPSFSYFFAVNFTTPPTSQTYIEFTSL